MTTLHLNVPLFAEPVSYNLAMPTDYQRQYHFVASEILHHGHSEVFRGNLSYDKFPEGIVVICKLVRGNLTRLKREAKFYCEQLKPLQGTHVPYFRGLYLGRHIEDEVDMPIGCIILQDCGSRITEKAIRKMGAMYAAFPSSDVPQIPLTTSQGRDVESSGGYPSCRSSTQRLSRR